MGIYRVSLEFSYGGGRFGNGRGVRMKTLEYSRKFLFLLQVSQVILPLMKGQGGCLYTPTYFACMPVLWNIPLKGVVSKVKFAIILTHSQVVDSTCESLYS